MILVTGATGFVGKHLVKRLQIDKIRCLVRKDTSFESNIEIVKGDLTDSESLEKATKNISTVIHLAAIIKSNKKEEYEKINIEGTKNLINACIKNGVKKFLYVSSCDVILKNKHEYAHSKLEAENIVKNSGLDYVIIRPTVIYGKDNEEDLGMLFNIIKKYPLAPVIGNGEYLLQPVHVDDIISIITKCLDLKEVNKTYFVAGPKALTFNEIIDAVSKVLSKNMIKIILKLFELTIKKFPFTYEKLLAVTENKVCNISPTKKDLNFEPITFEDGLKKIFQKINKHDS